MGSWRKAYGALKDSTRVGLAKVNSDFKVRGNGETGRPVVPKNDASFAPFPCSL